MLHKSRQLALALLLLNVPSGRAARKQVERAAFQPLFDSNDASEAVDAIDASELNAKELFPSMEEQAIPEGSIAPQTELHFVQAKDALDAIQTSANQIPPVSESKVSARVPASVQVLPEVVESKDAFESRSAAETVQASAAEPSLPVQDNEVPEVIGEVKDSQVKSQEGSDDSHVAISEQWPPQVWLSFMSSLTQGAVKDLKEVEALSVIFTLSCMAYSFWIFLRYGHDGTISLRLKVIENQRQQFQKAHDAFTGSTVQTLNALSESVALIAERSFEGKRRHFLKLIRRIRDHPDRVGSSADCAPAFKQLVSEWLAVFRECDLNLATSSEEFEELAEASTVDRMAVIACERLESTNASEITRELENFMGPLTQQGVKALEDTVKSGAFPLVVGCGERLCFTLLSVSHAAGLFVVFLGLLLAGAEAFLSQPWMATAVFCADACLFFVLLRSDKIDKMCRLEGEVRRLRLQSRAARRRHEQVAAFYKKAEAVTHLWLHRTMPQLEIFGGLFDLLWGPLASSADVAQFPTLAEKLSQMRGGLGPLHTWSGEEAMHVDEMQEVAGTLCDCADFIKGQADDAKPECLLDIIQHLDQMELPLSSQEVQTASAAP